MLGRCPLGPPTLGFANTGPEGLEGSTGSAPKLGPEACYREEFETAAAAGLINHTEPLSTSEVGLNFALLKRDLWSRLVAPTGTNAYL